MLHRKANSIALLYIATASVIPAGSKPVIGVDKSSEALLPPGFYDNNKSCPPSQSLLPLELDANIIKRIREEVFHGPSGTHEFESAPFPENKVLDMETLGKSGNGCAYGLKHEGQIVAVAKLYIGVLNGDNSVLESFLIETEALKMIKAYYGSYIYFNHDKNNRGLLLMRYEHGVPLIETKGYKETISPSGEFLMYDEDQDSQGHKLMFLRNVVEDIMKARKYYITHFKVAHGDLTLGNILFNKDYPESNDLPRLIDWESSEILLDDSEIQVTDPIQQALVEIELGIGGLADSTQQYD